MRQGEIKAAAGEKATGRKLTKPVYAYSLAWHPEQRPGKDHMLSTALDSLKAQGLEGYQAIILAHSDEPQQHVHVIVNRVHPETGKAATLSNNTRNSRNGRKPTRSSTGKFIAGSASRITGSVSRARRSGSQDPHRPRVRPGGGQ